MTGVPGLLEEGKHPFLEKSTLITLCLPKIRGICTLITYVCKIHTLVPIHGLQGNLYFCT